MRNLKKILAVICVVAMLASVAIVPALAATSFDTQATTLNNLGIMQGYGLTDSANRLQGLIFAIRAAGKEKAALAMSDADVTAALANVVDAKDIPAWGQKYAAYAVANALTKGVGGVAAPQIKFAPLAPVDARVFLTWVMNIGMGYKTDTNTALSDAVNAGIVTLSQALSFGGKAQIIRDDVAGMLWGAVSTGKTADGKKFIDTLVASGAVTQAAAQAAGLVAPPAPVALAVDSITALNTKQFQVVFNKEVDATTANNEANYTIGGAPAGKAVLAADKKTVLVTLAGETAMTNAGTADIKVLKAVKDAGGTALAADYAKTINVVDSTVPSFVSVTPQGNRTLKLTFDEPVYDANGVTTAIDLSEITIKSGIYSYVVQTAVADYASNSITVTVGTDLIEGALTIKINAPGMGGNAIRDFAGLILIPKEVSYTFAKDTSVATATLTEVNKAAKTAKVVFSKPVYGANVKLFHTINGEAAYGTPAVTVAQGAAATDWTFTFTNAIPSGALNFYLVNSATASEQITDLYGVKVPNQTFAFTVVADTVPPTVSTVTVNANTSIDVKFSENIDANEAVKAANFSVLKPDGTALAFTPTLQAADTVRLTASYVDNTTYTINVAAMKDVAGNAMAAAYSVQKTIGDNVAPTATAYLTDANTVYVAFSEAMNATDIANKANFLVKGNVLGDSDTLTVISSSKVKITYAAGGVVANNTVTVGPVRDLAGKKLVNESTFSTAVNIAGDSLTYTAAMTAPNKVKLTFNKVLSAFDPSDFTVAGAALLAVESNSVNSDGVSEVVIVLDTNLAYNATPNVTAAGGAKTKSAEGTVVTAGIVAATDKIAPIVDKVIFVNSTKIEVQFKEALDKAYFAASGVNGFSVAGSTTFTGAALVNPAANGSSVILTGTGFTANTDVTYNGTNGLRDANGNVLAAFTNSDALTAAALTLTKVNGTSFTIATNYTVDLSAANTDTADISGAKTAAVTTIDGFSITADKDFTTDAADVTIAYTNATKTFALTVGAGASAATPGDVVVSINDTVNNVTGTITFTEAANGTVTVK